MARPQIITGIDIGSSKIVTVIASINQEENEEEIRILGVANIPSKGIRKGQIVNIEETNRKVLALNCV